MKSVLSTSYDIEVEIYFCISVFLHCHAVLLLNLQSRPYECSAFYFLVIIYYLEKKINSALS